MDFYLRIDCCVYSPESLRKNNFKDYNMKEKLVFDHGQVLPISDPNNRRRPPSTLGGQGGTPASGVHLFRFKTL